MARLFICSKCVVKFKCFLSQNSLNPWFYATFEKVFNFCNKKAAYLLRNTDDSILEIMEKLHFTNTTHFYQCFKKQYYMTPREYRISNISSNYMQNHSQK